MLLKAFEFSDAAEICLQEAEKLNHKEPRWPYLQATLSRARTTSSVLDALRRTVALCGNDPEMPRLRLARLLAESGQENAAKEQLNHLLGAKPDFAPAQLLQAQLSERQHDWNDALRRAQAITGSPYTAKTAWTLVSSLYRRAGDTNAAVLATRRALAAAPDARPPDLFEDEVTALRSDARSLSDRAQNFLMARRAREAQPLINRLVQEHSDFPETWLLLGRAQFLQNQPGPAEKSLRKYLAIEPRSVNGQFQLGMTLLAQKRYPEAVAAFRQATLLKADFGPAFLNLGFALAKSGNPREAVAPFHEAIRHNPEIIDAYFLAADLHLQLGETADADALAKLAERIDPENPRLPVLRERLERHH
jgi:tetratricopeptide (TPR) repeat protein